MEEPSLPRIAKVVERALWLCFRWRRSRASIPRPRLFLLKTVDGEGRAARCFPDPVLWSCPVGGRRQICAYPKGILKPKTLPHFLPSREPPSCDRSHDSTSPRGPDSTDFFGVNEHAELRCVLSAWDSDRPHEMRRCQAAARQLIEQGDHYHRVAACGERGCGVFCIDFGHRRCDALSLWREQSARRLDDQLIDRRDLWHAG